MLHWQIESAGSQQWCKVNEAICGYCSSQKRTLNTKKNKVCWFLQQPAPIQERLPYLTSCLALF
eukprot:5779549-Amphidinium_carterae.1